MCVLFRGKAQGFLNDQVSLSLSLLPAKQKKHELPSYLRLSHALHSLKQTQLHIHLRGQTHTHTPAMKNIASDANPISSSHSQAKHFSLSFLNAIHSCAFRVLQNSQSYSFVAGDWFSCWNNIFVQRQRCCKNIKLHTGPWEHLLPVQKIQSSKQTSIK